MIGPHGNPGSIGVRRLDGGPRLVIDDPMGLALEFFTKDASSTGPDAYDDQVGRTDPVRIVDRDITTINQTMRARSPHSAWAPLLDTRDPLPWLAVLEPDWDLLELNDRAWDEVVAPTITDAFAATIAPYRNLAVATKVLHLKRPRLFPVLDRLVVEQIGGYSRPPLELVAHLRAEILANREAVSVVLAHLEEMHLRRTAVRVMDALLWTSHPASSLAREISGWEHRVSRRRSS